MASELQPRAPWVGGDVSVIIPAFKSAATIGRALASVGDQSAPPGEVVVIDDGSPDDTAAAAGRAKACLHGIPLTVLRQRNGGAGAARNRGIEIAKGRLLAFLDADDEWLPRKLERSLHHMNRGDAVLVAHDGWIVEGGHQPALNATSRRFAQGVDPFVVLYRKGPIDTCSVLARRDAVIAAGGFDETLPNAQDFELWLAMLQGPGSAFEVFDEPLVRYHVSPGSIMSHTDRRLACCLAIASRYAMTLSDRQGGWLGNLTYRLLAVHYEAMRAHLRAGRWGSALRVGALAPLRAAAAIRAVRSAHDPRPSYIRGPRS